MLARLSPRRSLPVRLLVELLALVALFVAGQLLLGRLGSGLGLIATAALVAAGYVLVVRALEQRPLAELAPAHALPELGVGVFFGAGAFAATIGIIALLGGYTVSGTNDVRTLLAPVPMALASGVAEELVVRGVLFRVLAEWVGMWIALAVSAALFGLMHLGNPGATVWSSLAIALEAGVLLGAAFALTGRLWLPIGMHAAWNWTQAAFGVAVSGHRVDGFLRSELRGPEWLTGGSFGAEASVVAVVVSGVVSAAMLWRIHRRSATMAP